MALDAKTSLDQTLPLHIYLKILNQKLQKFLWTAQWQVFVTWWNCHLFTFCCCFVL